MFPNSRRGLRGDLWRVARLLPRRGQGHAARQGDLRTAILIARGAAAAAASGMNAKRVRMSALGQTEKYSARGDLFRSSPRTDIGRPILVSLRSNCADPMLWNIGVRFGPDRTGRYYHSPRRWFVTHRYMPSTFSVCMVSKAVHFLTSSLKRTFR